MPTQRVGIRVEDTELDGVLHLPDTGAVGGAAVLHGFGGHPDQPHIVATCEALANAGVAALRFAYRDHQPPRMTLASGLADAAGAIRVLKAHPDVPERLGVVGFSFGGTVAALVAGRDSRVRAAALAAAPAQFGDDPKWKPVAELSRPGETVMSGGVTIMAPLNVPATMPLHASLLFSRNLTSFVLAFTKDKAFQLDLSDDIQQGAIITHDGEVKHARTRDALNKAGG